MKNNQDNQTQRGYTHRGGDPSQDCSSVCPTRPPVLVEVVLGDTLSSKRILLQKDLHLAQNFSTPMSLLESACLIIGNTSLTQSFLDLLKPRSLVSQSIAQSCSSRSHFVIHPSDIIHKQHVIPHFIGEIHCLLLLCCLNKTEI